MTIIKTINGVHRTKTNKEINKPTCIQNANKINTNKETNNTTTTINPINYTQTKAKASNKVTTTKQTIYFKKKHTYTQKTKIINTKQKQMSNSPHDHNSVTSK